MTTSQLNADSAPAPAPGRAAKALRILAIAACAPYLSLKVSWILGGRTGIPEGSALLDHPTTMVIANTATVLMDACVIVLALLLTQAWGLRVRAWLLVLPMWAATGLLVPIMAGFPVQLLIQLLGGSVRTQSADEPFLDSWVFSVVYGGFILQGLALGGLFVGYARRRWGHVWRGRLAELTPGRKGAAVAAAVFAVLPVSTHLMWAFGATTGLSTAMVDDRAGDFHALEALNALYPLAAVTGALLLAFRLAPGLGLRLPLALVWVGSAATACWGGWLLLAALTTADTSEGPTALMLLTYAGSVITGVLVLLTGAHHARRRMPRTAVRDGAPAVRDGAPETPAPSKAPAHTGSAL
ncbi:hypothetical protein [Streptomyces sp. KLOTTS4A1]|uniref:hypothetical protein n=1 Tax=Streptomyces sp. KLOTTS4A1 TaxID=3390996 RepID=UPI0039F5660C